MADEWYDSIYENRNAEVNEFIRRKKETGRSLRTLNEYSRMLREFFHDVYPDTDPADITVEDVENYVSILDERGCVQNTKRRYLETLSSFYGWAVKRPRFEEIVGDPAAVVLEELPKEVHDRPPCATWENAVKIVHTIGDPRDKAVTAFMAKTGVRVSEALGIRMEGLMLDDGFVRVRNRKGGKSTMMPVDEEMQRVFERYLFTRPTDSDTDHVFVSIRGGKLTRERIRRIVRRAALEAGVMEEKPDSEEYAFAEKFTPHTFRTVFTTLMRNQQMPDHILRYLRGDAAKETMDIYTRVDREEARTEYLKRIKSLDL